VLSVPIPAAARHCPLCGSPVPEALSPSGRRRRGRPRVFCSERCRRGERRSPLGEPAPAVLREQAAAFAAAVRAAIAGSGLSLRDLERRLVETYPPLASSVATLSAWQTGASTPPQTPSGRDRVLALERCLGVPAGDLALLVPGSGVVLPPRPPTGADLAARRARLEHLVTALAGFQQVLPVGLAEETRVGPAGRPVGALVTLRLRAAHDGVDRFWFVDGGDPRLRPAVAVVAGARVVRTVREPGPVAGARLVATELRLPRALARGERHELTVRVRYGAAGPLVARRVVHHPYERLDLSVSFDPAAVPVAVLACRWRHRDGAEVDRAEVTRPGASAYRLGVADPAPGGYGWRWTPGHQAARDTDAA
jgi:hypothetical protein